MSPHEIEIRFECQARTRLQGVPWADMVQVTIHGERDVEKAIAWARKQFRLSNEEFAIAEIKSGRRAL